MADSGESSAMEFEEEQEYDIDEASTSTARRRSRSSTTAIACPFGELSLPTSKDVICHLLFKQNEHMKETKRKCVALKAFVPQTLEDLEQLWQRAKIPTINSHSIKVKIERLAARFTAARRDSRTTPFVASLLFLFDIAACKCDLTAAGCTCANEEWKIPQFAKDFIVDQRAGRNMTIPIPPNVASPEPISTTTAFNTPTASEYIPESDMALLIESEMEPGTSATGNAINVSVYGQSYTKFAIECDRFGISDRAASALATAILNDLDLSDNAGNRIIIDRNKIRREREKARQIVLKRVENVSTLEAFSFDSRKNKARATDRKDDRNYPRVVDENHVVILKQPNSVYLGHAVIPPNSKAPEKAKVLIDFFEGKNISLDCLLAVSCDGEPTNTGRNEGIIRTLEKHLNRPLHWFVCLLHFNELPFRHIFTKIDGATSGPRTSSGPISKEISTCENSLVLFTSKMVIQHIINYVVLLCSRSCHLHKFR